MSLKNYPIKLNDIVLPFSDSLWSEDYSNIQNVNTSEVGTDIVQYTRLGKLSLKLSFTLFASWIPIFEGFAFGGETIMVSLFDKTSGGYKVREMRMDKYSKKPVERSELLENMDGMWNFSFTLIEM